MPRLPRMATLALACALLAPATASAGWLPATTLSAGDDAVTAAAGNDVYVGLGVQDGPVSLRIKRGGGPFGAPIAITPAGDATDFFDMSVAPDGTAAFIWRTPTEARARLRLPNGTLTAVQTLSSAGEQIQEPEVDLAANGIAVFTWRDSSGVNRLRTRARAVNGTLSATSTFSQAGVESADVDTAVSPTGRAVYAWEAGDLLARSRSAAGAFSGFLTLDTFGNDTDVAMDTSGNATVAWRDAGIETRRVLSDDTLGPVVEVSGPLLAQDPAVAVDGAGVAHFGWNEKPSASAEFAAHTRTRSPDGSLSAPTLAQVAGDQSLGMRIGVNQAGDRMLTWRSNTASQSLIQARGVSRSGLLQPLGTLDRASSVGLGGSAVDPLGHGTVVWVTPTAVRAAVHDPVPPVVGSLAGPSAMERTVPGTFSVSPSDVYGPVRTSIAFGDGTSAASPRAAHAFSRTGTFTVRATATDAGGNARSATKAVRVVDTRRPAVSRLSLGRRVFRLGRRRTPAAAQRKRRPRGTSLRFTLSEASRVTVAFERRKRSRRRRFARVRRFTLARSLRAGRQRIAFSGRIGRRKLRPGRYRATLRAVDPSGNRSRRVRGAFRVVR